MKKKIKKGKSHIRQNYTSMKWKMISPKYYWQIAKEFNQLKEVMNIKDR